MTRYFDQTGPLYLEAQRADDRVLRDRSSTKWLALMGAPYDGSASFRPGARFGPDAIRAASVGLESYSPRLDVDLLDFEGRFVDFGNIEIPLGNSEATLATIQRAVAKVLSANGTPVTLGGDHSITQGCVRAASDVFDDLVVVQLDAHADLRPEYLGDLNSHASVMRRCVDLVGRDSVVQCGIRSGTREEFAELRSSGQFCGPVPSQLRALLAPLKGRPVYLTIDLDVFDPSTFPATGTPEPGGIWWPEFEALLEVVAEHNIVATDVVELAPQLELSGISSMLAAKVVRELALSLLKP